MRSLRKDEDNPFTRLGRAVARRRRSLHLTQADLAALAGCSELFVRELEHGKESLRLDKLLDVLHILGLHLVVADGQAGVVTDEND